MNKNVLSEKEWIPNHSMLLFLVLWSYPCSSLIPVFVYVFVCVHFMLTLHIVVSVDYISHPPPFNQAWSESPRVNSREYYRICTEFVHTRAVTTPDTGMVGATEIQMAIDNLIFLMNSYANS